MKNPIARTRSRLPLSRLQRDAVAAEVIGRALSREKRGGAASGDTRDFALLVYDESRRACWNEVRAGRWKP